MGTVIGNGLYEASVRRAREFEDELDKRLEGKGQEEKDRATLLTNRHNGYERRS